MPVRRSSKTTKGKGPGGRGGRRDGRGARALFRRRKFCRFTAEGVKRIEAMLRIARTDRDIVATLRLASKKPWAIDRAYFADVKRPVYLTDMAVAPQLQRHGIGRRILEEAKAIAREWPADAIRLDAYDAPAGAGEFYEKCGFTQVGAKTYRGVPLLYFELLL